MSDSDVSRRAFLRRAGALSMMGTAAPWALNLAAMADAAAASSAGASSDDYKALVCVFLHGGNDHANTIVPLDAASHALYSGARGSSLALPLSSLQATALNPPRALPDGRQMALAPSLAPLKPMFDAGKLAVLLNIGPLMQPTTLADFEANRVPLPPKLFSHNDQQSVWQSYAQEGAPSGWGGRLGDLFMSGNGKAAFTCVNVAGNAIYLSGDTAVPYIVNPYGPFPLQAAQGELYGSKECAALFKRVVTQPASVHVMAHMHAQVMRRAIEAQADLSQALKSATALSAVFDAGNSLAVQLGMVARMVSARKLLGIRRQVFFVSLGGFDTHDSLSAQHPVLLAKVAQALKTFTDATNELGVANQVTTFTASDFGRTLSSNGDGSDHGWGGHHLVMGGAVQGGRFYGALPEAGLKGPQDAGQGRLLPTLAVDQLAGALAGWMGVSATDQRTLIAPHLSAFDGGALSELLVSA